MWLCAAPRYAAKKTRSDGASSGTLHQEQPACLRLRISAKHMSDSGLSNANMPINLPHQLVYII